MAKLAMDHCDNVIDLSLGLIPGLTIICDARNNFLLHRISSLYQQNRHHGKLADLLLTAKTRGSVGDRPTDSIMKVLKPGQSPMPGGGVKVLTKLALPALFALIVVASSTEFPICIEHKWSVISHV